VLLDTLIASFLATGSIAWLYYADRLMEFPLGVFSIALATVILPGLAAQHAAQAPERFSATLDWALRLVVIVVLPATLALVVLAGPLTVTIFHYGKFDEHDVRMTSLALMAYASALLAFSMVKVLAPGYFARQDTRTPVRIGIRSLGVSMGLNLLVVLPLAFATPAAPDCTRCWRSTPASAPGTTRPCSTAACAGRACCTTPPAGAACCGRCWPATSSWWRSCGGSRATRSAGSRWARGRARSG
jgi:murein biosynthesis integral membrane protein MurJ